MNYTIAFYDSFKPSLNELAKYEYAATMTTVMELAEAPENPGLNVHRVGTAATTCWSALVNDDIRLIFFRSGNHVIPAYVDHHDDAYRWAEGRSLDVHPDTGAAQIVIVGERREEIKRIVVREVHEPQAAKPYANISDETLLAYGTPKDWLEPIRSATEEAFLADIFDAIPDESRACRQFEDALHIVPLETGSSVSCTVLLVGKDEDRWPTWSTHAYWQRRVDPYPCNSGEVESVRTTSKGA